jgi:GT2 family glycosyltransferase
MPDALEKLIKAIEADPAATAAHGLAEWMEGDVIRDAGSLPYFQRERFAVRGGRVELMRREEPTVFESVAFDCRTFPLCCVLMRRSALERVGELFDAQFRISQDWELFFRLSALGHFAMVDEPICLYRRHGHNLSGNRKAMEGEFVHIRRKAYRSDVLSAEQKQTVRAAHRLFQKHKANMWLGTARGALERGRWLEAAKWVCYWAVNVQRYLLICVDDPISREGASTFATRPKVQRGRWRWAMGRDRGV